MKTISKKIDIIIYQQDILEILKVLLDHPKGSLKHKLKDIVNSLLSILVSDPLNTNSQRIFEILHKLDNKDYMYHIMPVFSRILQNAVDENIPCNQIPL